VTSFYFSGCKRAIAKGNATQYNTLRIVAAKKLGTYPTKGFQGDQCALVFYTLIQNCRRTKRINLDRLHEFAQEISPILPFQQSRDTTSTSSSSRF
jgi:hypothetical protein